MLTVKKNVYYCEFCKRSRMTAASILRHEPRCIYNPSRSVCGWHNDTPPPVPANFADVFKDDPDVDLLRIQMDGCPACMLAIIVQARRLGLDGEDAWDFKYPDEVVKYRENERYKDVAW